MTRQGSGRRVDEVWDTLGVGATRRDAMVFDEGGVSDDTALVQADDIAPFRRQSANWFLGFLCFRGAAGRAAALSPAKGGAGLRGRPDLGGRRPRLALELRSMGGRASIAVTWRRVRQPSTDVTPPGLVGANHARRGGV